jgi:carbon-monoxide dehydrogenase large subunit
MRIEKFGGHGHTGRIEDFRFVTGTGRYVDDIRLTGMAHAHIVRSSLAHARIRSIDTSSAIAMPGVVAVLTGADLIADGIGTIPCVSRPRRADGTIQSIIEPPHRALAVEHVRMVGDAVAVVIAETISAAKDAGEAIRVDYESLPAVVGLEAAVAPGAPRLWPDAPDNVSFSYEIGEKAAVDAAMAKAAHVARLTIDINRVSANPMELRAIIGDYDRGLGRFTLHVGHQTPHQIRHILATRIFQVPEHQMRIVSPDVGGGFGLKGGLFAEDIIVLCAARRVGRPVKWLCERSEAFLSDDHARESLVKAALALDRDGRFLALQFDALANLGAYVSFRGAHPPTNNLGSLSGPYTTPAIYAQVRGVFSNTRPTSSYRGAGRPEATYVLERLIDVAAADIGIDPFELRRRNAIPAAAMPYRTSLLFTYDSGDFQRNMDIAAAKADLAGFAARRRQSRAAGKLRGLGIANAIEQAGGPVGAPWEERAEIRFAPTGGVSVLVGTMSNGQGHETIFQRLVSERLGIERSTIRVLQGDTDVSPFGRGSFGSRSMMAGGSAVSLACDKVVEKGRRIAAFLLQAADADIDFTDGRFIVAGATSSVAIGDVIKAAFGVNTLPQDLEGGLDQGATFAPPAPTYPNGCHVCELEVDPETGKIDILRYVVVDDVGTVLDHAMVQGQVQGGVAQGLGQCLSESIVYDASGQIVTGSFMDYGMPRADDVPACEIFTEGTATTNNPLGVKGAGEAGTIGALPAVMNAIVDALSPLGIRHIDMPATPERIWRAIKSAAGRRPS